MYYQRRMAASNIFDGIINNLIASYFRETNITALVVTYKRTLQELTENQYVWQNKNDHSLMCVQIVMVFVMSLLVENGSLAELERASTTTIQQTVGKVCQIEYNSNFCSQVSVTDKYANWTHLILFYISCLRAFKVPYFDYGNNRVSMLEYKGGALSEGFLHNVTLLLYALLMLRLTYVILFIKGSDVRAEIESCLFLVVASFYSQYVYLRRTMPLNSPTVLLWDKLYKHVTDTYLKPGKVFKSLNAPYPIVRYLDQDLAPSLHKCLLDNFIRPNEPKMFDSLALIDSTDGLMCLYRLNVNGITVRIRQWVRNITTSKYAHYASKLVTVPLGGLYQAGKAVGKSAITAYETVEDMYDEDFPVRSRAGQLACGLIAFTGDILHASLMTGASAIGKSVKSAFVFVFSKRDLFPKNVDVALTFQIPRRPAYLVWKRSKDGRYDAIYTIHPLPKPEITGDIQYGKFSQWGGVKGKGKGKSNDATKLLESMDKGFLKKGHSTETQEWVKIKLGLTVKLGGIGKQKGGRRHQIGGIAIPDDLILDSTEDYDPDLYDYQVLEFAQDPATVIEDGDEFRLILPVPPLEKQALENSVYFDIPEPAASVKPKGSESTLPPETPIRRLIRRLSRR